MDKGGFLGGCGLVIARFMGWFWVVKGWLLGGYGMVFERLRVGFCEVLLGFLASVVWVGFMGGFCNFDRRDT